LSTAAWEEAFAKYQAFPEYQKLNVGMTLGEFKRIFAFEYAHRVLGRGVGLVFGLPMLWFFARRRVSIRFGLKLFGLFSLGGLQGFVGWWMVKSGLVDRPDVSQYRLATHFGLAVLIYALTLRTALGILRPPASSASSPRRGLARFAFVLAVAVYVTAVSGAFVAGLDAGLALNSGWSLRTYPWMGDSLVPPGLLALEPAWRNLFENVITVQFDHRWLAQGVAAGVVVFWWRARSVELSPTQRLAVHSVLGVVLMQVALGVTTLMSGVAVPVASAHQLGALFLLTTVLFTTNELRR
jgi:cytochrome c oxidase assembly protein subunit 15